MQVITLTAYNRRPSPGEGDCKSPRCKTALFSLSPSSSAVSFRRASIRISIILTIISTDLMLTMIIHLLTSCPALQTT